ncbi:MAG: type III-B CRISPR module RAMP protein Cmr6 [Alcanivoracaceae bacterium]
MPIAAVPGYLGNDFRSASPGLRFGLYFQGWNNNWRKHVPDARNNESSAVKSACAMTDSDIAAMQSLLKRQQAAFNSTSNNVSTLQLDAISTSPLATGLGNEHPTENGFTFLNPYGLPYLPGSGVKGVLRQAAHELASGEWGESDWTDACILALFGPEPGAETLIRGALTFWDVLPQVKGNSLTVEIMTPHQKHYYQEGKSPHDSGQPVPITFLSVPPGSGFTFHVQCHRALLESSAQELMHNDKWKHLLQSAFEHAFNWLGFGAKSAIGYGAMQEDESKKREREKQQAEQREQERRLTLSPADLAYEESRPVIEKFRRSFEAANKAAYQPGQEFDSKRNEFIQAATAWSDQRSRSEASCLLEETLKWGISKKGKDRLRAVLLELKPKS